MLFGLLCPACQVAESRREAALSSYVSDQLQYSKFWKLLEFADKLDKLLQVNGSDCKAHHSPL